MFGFNPPFEFETVYSDTTLKTPLINQAKHIINSSLGYDYKGFSIRVSYRKVPETFIGFVANVHDVKEEEKYSASFQQWDISITQDIPWITGLQIFLNASNLNNAIRGDYLYLSETTKVNGETPSGSATKNSSDKYTQKDEQYSNFIIAGFKYQF
ncbi:MAG: hypothetical protein HC905_10040 [Bacteroidales bacterium]|nr:hypothetical protein [Bacteroidales bacterium]